MYEDDTFDEEFEDDGFSMMDPIDRIIKKLRTDNELTDEEEGFWLGFQRAA